MSERRDNIYIYLWEEFNTIYIGRTINPKGRHYAHKHRNTERTYQFSSEHHVEHPKMIIIENDLTIEEGIEREKYWINEYRNNTPYNVLNKVEGGSIGNLNKGKWSKKAVFEEAKKYPTRAKLKYVNNTVYTVARKNGWLDEIFGTEKNIKPILKWTKKAVFEEAKKYMKKHHFEQGCASAYQTALKNKWISEMNWFKDNDYFVKWSKETVFKESKKYFHRKQFRVGSPGAYYAALKNEWLDEMTWLTPDVKWTKEKVFEESKKYKTRAEFKRENCGAYRASIKNGWIDEMIWLPFVGCALKWTKEKTIEESKKYRSRNEFKHGSCGAYNAARKNKWIDEMLWLNKD